MCTRGRSVVDVKPTSVRRSFLSAPGGRYFVTEGNGAMGLSLTETDGGT